MKKLIFAILLTYASSSSGEAIAQDALAKVWAGYCRGGVCGDQDLQRLHDAYALEAEGSEERKTAQHLVRLYSPAKGTPYWSEISRQYFEWRMWYLGCGKAEVQRASASQLNPALVQKALPVDGPCSWAENCDDPAAKRLKEAFASSATSVSQRAKMKEFVKRHTNRGIANWATAAAEYFAWRALDVQKNGPILTGTFSYPAPASKPRCPPNPLSAVTPITNNNNMLQPTRPKAFAGYPSVVQLERQGGVFEVKGLINDSISLNFIVDSGASDVSLPSDVVSVLIRSGTIQKSDFIGATQYILADGSRMPSMRFNIRSLTIGGVRVENIVGSVANENAPLLLGQSFLRKFSKWSVNTKDETLHLEK